MEFRATGPFHILTLIKDETRRRNFQLAPQSTSDRHRPHLAFPKLTWAASETVEVIQRLKQEDFSQTHSGLATEERKKNSVRPPPEKPIYETKQTSRNSDNGSNSPVSLLELLISRVEIKSWLFYWNGLSRLSLQTFRQNLPDWDSFIYYLWHHFSIGNVMDLDAQRTLYGHKVT